MSLGNRSKFFKQRLVVLALCCLCTLVVAAPNKWTIFVYMLADNDLEQFGLMDMEEIMGGMAAEPAGCSFSQCGAACPTGTVLTYPSKCSEGSGTRSRCCPKDTYPDVLVLVDRGDGKIPAADVLSYSYPHADYSYLTSQWSTAKELLALPGGQWEQLKDHSEIDMANPSVLADFLQRGLARFPPEADGSRKYMLVFWDHGSGWFGYGVDHTCTALSSYSANYGCDMMTTKTLARGLANGLKHPTTGDPVVLDIIGFDACLMAMYEVATSLAPFARHLLVSELLEPGHGWDYARPIGSITQQMDVTSQAVASLSSLDVARLAIQGYFDQAAAYGTSGLTLAMLDVTAMSTTLLSSMNNLFEFLANELGKSPAYAMSVLRQRIALNKISGGEQNVDLGAWLIGLRKGATSSLAALVDPTLTAYTASVLAFKKDAELADGTGASIYFPSSDDNLNSRYTDVVAADASALGGWMSFLDRLYKATSLYTNDPSSGTFKFIESYAVPYKAVSSNTWITHGTLSNYMGLSATLMYGFRTPTRTAFIVAGNTEGNVVNTSAVGAWSGYLFGLVQDLVPGDDAMDGLALAYVDEQRLTDASGKVNQLVLQVQVYYASSCYAATVDMKKGVIKYVYNTTTLTTTLQLFVSASGNWGEVPPAQGGVVIPYLGSYDLTTTNAGRVGVSFGYSDCLKWGYNGTIQLAAFSAAQAATVLGLDLAKDMETQLLVQSIDGDTKGIPGYFRPAKITKAGCQCSQMWAHALSTASNLYESISGKCINPDGDANGAWCMYEPDSCTGPAAPADSTKDYCTPITTLSGCKCHPNWTFKNQPCYGDSIDDGDPRGAWCVVDKETCPGSYRAHEFGDNFMMKNVTVNGQPETLTGLDFDYTQVTTVKGCHCRNPWSYAGVQYNGGCRQGLPAGVSSPGITAHTSWCYIDDGCSGAGQLGGYSYDICTTEGGRLTDAGAACELPTTYDGVTLYDCITYNHSLGTTGDKAWCFTSSSTGEWSYCAPWSCSAAVKRQCPAANPATSGANLASWATTDCLEALCNARQALANISQCTQDSQADQDMLVQRYAFLNASAGFNEVLQQQDSTAGSLEAYCTTKYGQLCVDQVLDPACPALFRANNVWYLSSNTTKLCSTGCLQVLCALQEQGKARVKGGSNLDLNAASAKGVFVPAGSCADAQLESRVRWMIMQYLDAYCDWQGSANLACNKVLSPPQQCAADNLLEASAGTFSDGSTADEWYSASSTCSWTISLPDQPYISLNFTQFDTENMYDVVTVEDFDGVIGMFSGTDTPPALSTDTGLMRVNFTADGTIQGHGFAASYLASTSPQVQLPTCTGKTKLLQVVLRSRQYGAELSWLITARGVFNALNAPSSLNIVMAGGMLPSSLRPKVPAAIAEAANPEYKDFRSYYSYACLPIGDYALNMYDSYGDGWNGGRISLTQSLNVTTGCLLVSDTATKYNKTVPFIITEDADINSAACSSLTNPGAISAPYYIEVGLVIVGEDSKTFNLAKQRKLKQAVALLMDVDTGQASIQSIFQATTNDLSSIEWGNKSSVAIFNATTTGSSSANADSQNVDVQFARQVTQIQTIEESGSNGSTQHSKQQTVSSTQQRKESRYQPEEGARGLSVRQLLQQQRQQSAGDGNGGFHSDNSGTMAALAKFAVPIPDLVASAVFDDVSKQLQAAQEQLVNSPATAGVAANAAAAVSGGVAAARSAQELGQQTDSGPAVCAAAAVAGVDDAAALGEIGSGESRRLQQLLILNQHGHWQQQQPVAATGSAAAAPKPGAEDTVVQAAGMNDPNVENEGSDTASLTNALAAQPVYGPSGITNASEAVSSELLGILRPIKPTTGIQQTGHSSKGVGQLQHVMITQSFREAFLGAGKGAGSGSSSSMDGSGSIGSSTNDVVILADGHPGTIAFDAGGYVVPISVPAGQTAGSDSGNAAIAFQAVSPGRVLLEGAGLSVAATTQAAASPQQQQQWYQQEAAVAGAVKRRQRIAAVPAHAAVAIVNNGRLDPLFTNRQSRAGSSNSNSTGSQLPAGRRTGSADVYANGSAIVPEAIRAGPGHVIKEGWQPPFRLAGPKRPIRHKAGKHFSPTAIHDVPQHLRPVAGRTTLTAATAADEAIGSNGKLQRQLLATNTSGNGLLIISRISGYESWNAATAAATVLEDLVTNGTLHSTLAAQGWSVNLGLAYTKVGKNALRWAGLTFQQKIIIAAASGGVGVCLTALVFWLWIRRVRGKGAARVPVPPVYQHNVGNNRYNSSGIRADGNNSRGVAPPVHANGRNNATGHNNQQQRHSQSSIPSYSPVPTNGQSPGVMRGSSPAAPAPVSPGCPNSRNNPARSSSPAPIFAAGPGMYPQVLNIGPYSPSGVALSPNNAGGYQGGVPQQQQHYGARAADSPRASGALQGWL